MDNTQKARPPDAFSSCRTLRFLLAVVFAASAVLPAQGQNYRSLSFPNSGYGYGINPRGPVTIDSAGNLYGVANGGIKGGLSYAGTVWRVSATGTPSVLHTFQSMGDGEDPVGVVADNEGNIYGTTYSGGYNDVCFYECGTVFKVDTFGNETILYTFKSSPDGLSPASPLIRDEDGNLYGTTRYGGTGNCIFGCGTVFKIDTGGNETVLYSFQGDIDGEYPQASVVRDSNGNLFGTTPVGGVGGSGVVFKLDAGGQESVLYSFAGGEDGSAPYSSLVLDSSGRLYGTTSRGGGECDCGVVFTVSATGTEAVLYRFTGGVDGGWPMAGLTLDSNGNLYGTASAGGMVPCNTFFTSGCGTVFQISQNGSESTLHTFHLADGADPESGLTWDAAGHLYGNTFRGGSGSCASHKVHLGCGVVFRLAK